MGKRWYYFLFMTWISYLLSSSLLLYTDGFFLTRIARTESSKCTKCTSEGNCSVQEIFKDTDKSASICLEARSRVILLIVDALKYEFIDWHKDVEVNATYHLNKIPVVQDLLRTAPENTRLFKAIADAPTTTMQRLKALTTGTLPTFIDAGSNFASESISEDNLIEQSSKNGGVVFMGDDTWISLFPDKFLRQIPLPSFNVWDLDTVDRQVRDAIVPELGKSDWSLLVAHVLGVDHCGHKHGPHHPEMARKLRETNALIALIVESLPEDAILIVIGDHGMTESGDHGGDSRNEIEAGMFVYSSLALLPKTNEQSGNVVNQIDIVPTISSLLGIPLPFSNIGAVIVECLPRINSPQSEHFWFAAHSLWRNVVQMKKYIEAYSGDSFLFGKEQLEKVNRLFEAVENGAKGVQDENSFRRFAESSKKYLQTVRDLCAEIWIQFDPSLMSQGLIIFFCVLFFVYIMLSALDEFRTNEIMKTSFLFVSIAGNVITSFTTFGLYKLGFIEEFKNSNTFATGTLSVALLALLVAQNWDTISSTWYNGVKLKKVHYLERGIILLSFCGLFSNSFIVEEDKVTMYLLVTMVALLTVKTIEEDNNYLVYGSGEKRWRHDKHVGRRRSLKYVWILVGLVACGAIRFSSYLWRCREEQGRETCTMLAKKSDLLNNAGAERTLLIVSVVSLAMYVTIVTTWLRNTERLSEFFPIANIARYCYGVIAVTIGCYWVYDRLPKEAKVKVAISRQINALPGIAYFFALFGVVNVYFRPLGIFWLPPKSKQLTVDDRRPPTFFTKLRELFYSRQFIDESEFPMISSSITFYSSAFISLSVFLSLLWALVLGNIFALGTFLMFVTCTAVLGLVAIERCYNANNLAEMLQVPDSAILCWFFIAEYFFYGTGHQPTFPTLHWDAAFVGNFGNSYGNLLPAILIGLNTFGSHLIVAMTLPLLTIVPFTFYMMFPVKLKFYGDAEMRKGEYILFERDSTFHNALFTVYGKYILLHGIRTFGCMLTTTIHCRHLMAWKIFAPKLIFQGLSFLVTLGSILASLLMTRSIDSQVEDLRLRGVMKAR